MTGNAIQAGDLQVYKGNLNLFLSTINKNNGQSEKFAELEKNIAELTFALFAELQKNENTIAMPQTGSTQLDCKHQSGDQLDFDSEKNIEDMLSTFFVSMRSATTTDEVEHYIDVIKKIMPTIESSTNNSSVLSDYLLASIHAYRDARYAIHKLKSAAWESSMASLDIGSESAGIALNVVTLGGFTIGQNIVDVAGKAVKAAAYVKTISEIDPEKTFTGYVKGFFNALLIQPIKKAWNWALDNPEKAMAITAGAIIGATLAFVFFPVTIAAAALGVLYGVGALISKCVDVYGKYKASKERKAAFDQTVSSFRENVTEKGINKELTALRSVKHVLSGTALIAQQAEINPANMLSEAKVESDQASTKTTAVNSSSEPVLLGSSTQQMSVIKKRS